MFRPLLHVVFIALQSRVESMGSGTSDTHPDDVESADRKEELWLAFRCGFAAGRNGAYYADLPAISERAARTEFEQFSQGMLTDSQ